MAKRKKPINYRALKNALNKYFDFSFKMPRKGRDFAPQQKSAITRKYKKIAEYIGNPGISWLPYPKSSKLPNVDGVRADKGLFYKFPYASLRYSKKDKKYHVVITPKAKKGERLVSKRRDVLYLFPPHVRENPQLIAEFVGDLKEKYKPDEIRWSIASRRESTAYDESVFNFYFSIVLTDYDTGEEIDESELSDDEVSELGPTISKDIWRKRKYEWKQQEDSNFYNGVFLIYYVGETKQRRKRAKK